MACFSHHFFENPSPWNTIPSVRFLWFDTLIFLHLYLFRTSCFQFNVFGLHIRNRFREGLISVSMYRKFLEMIHKQRFYSTCGRWTCAVGFLIGSKMTLERRNCPCLIYRTCSTPINRRLAEVGQLNVLKRINNHCTLSIWHPGPLTLRLYPPKINLEQPSSIINLFLNLVMHNTYEPRFFTKD